jgi:hypothetical protein
VTKRRAIGIIAALLLTQNLLSVRSARAQALCGPGFGTTPPGLICVHVTSSTTGGTIQEFVGSTGMVVATTLGDYTTMLMAVYLVTPGGMAVGLAGMVEKTGDTTPGSTITVEVEGGRAGPLGPGAGALSLDGATTGTGQVTIGGAAGFVSFGDDLLMTGFPAVIDIPLFGAGAFLDSDPSAGSVASGSVAVRLTHVFNLTVMGEMIMIPAGAGAGDPVFPLDDTGQIGRQAITLLLPIGLRSGHFSFEQFRVVTGPECDTDPHYHLRFDLTEGVSLEGDTFVEEDPCGAGKTSEITVQTVTIIETPTTLASDYVVPTGGGLYITPFGSLTVPPGVQMIIPEGTSVTNLGTMTNNGLVDNLGTIYNWANATVINNGTLNNFPSGTVVNEGAIVNNDTFCNDGTLNSTGTISGNAVGSNCILFADGFESGDVTVWSSSVP